MPLTPKEFEPINLHVRRTRRQWLDISRAHFLLANLKHVQWIFYLHESTARLIQLRLIHFHQCTPNPLQAGGKHVPAQEYDTQPQQSRLLWQMHLLHPLCGFCNAHKYLSRPCLGVRELHPRA